MPLRDREQLPRRRFRSPHLLLLLSLEASPNVGGIPRLVLQTNLQYWNASFLSTSIASRTPGLLEGGLEALVSQISATKIGPNFKSLVPMLPQLLPQQAQPPLKPQPQPRRHKSQNRHWRKATPWITRSLATSEGRKPRMYGWSMQPIASVRGSRSLS